MQINRIAKHLVTTHWGVNRAFPVKVMTAIVSAITASRSAHVGEISFAVEGALHSTALANEQSSRHRALEIFSQRRVWDTEHRNGLLIYLLLADRAVEIVADRGINAKVNSHEWDGICRTMESALKHGNYESGVVSGIQAVTQLLIKHFPACRAFQQSGPPPMGPPSIIHTGTRRAS
jgi:uncharacterized membrane protein